MAKIQIRSRWDDSVLYEGDLSGAYLTGANLTGADLAGANDADSVTLPEGVTFAEFKSAILPAFLTAGGKTLESFKSSWECHDWTNCPTKHAHDADSLARVPAVWRPWANRFIQLFDAKSLPWSVVEKLLAPTEALEASTSSVREGVAG